MRAGRARYTQPVIVRVERGLRDAAAEAARKRGLTLSECIRRDLRSLAGRVRVSEPVRRVAS